MARTAWCALPLSGRRQGTTSAMITQVRARRPSCRKTALAGPCVHAQLPQMSLCITSKCGRGVEHFLDRAISHFFCAVAQLFCCVPPRRGS